VPYSGLAARTVTAPQTPEGYTAVGLGDTVAFVPATHSPPTPSKVPDGYSAMSDERLGTLYVPTRYAGMMDRIPFGATATGSPEPVVKVTTEYKFPPTPGLPGVPSTYGAIAPKDYTAVQYGPTYAFVPAKRDAEVPAKPPPGFIAVRHPKAGTIFVPMGYGPGAALSSLMPFGAAATGMPEPVVSLAPTPPRTYSVPVSPSGTRSFSAPPVPEGYTAVVCNDTIAFVPARKDARADPPDGYVAVAHPTAGTVFLPARYASGGRPVDGVMLGVTATGEAAPASPVSQSYRAGGRDVIAPPAPAGYTAMLYSNIAIAFVPTSASPPEPTVPWGYAAATFPGSGKILLPAGYASGGLPRFPTLPFGAVADGMPEPGVPVIRG
jgi:hypothetical protein